VGGIAGCRLLYCRQHKLPVPRQSSTEGMALLHEPAKCADVHNRSRTCNADDGPVESNIIVNSG
jgi:hypothetical protein